MLGMLPNAQPSSAEESELSRQITYAKVPVRWERNADVSNACERS